MKAATFVVIILGAVNAAVVKVPLEKLLTFDQCMCPDLIRLICLS